MVDFDIYCSNHRTMKEKRFRTFATTLTPLQLCTRLQVLLCTASAARLSENSIIRLSARVSRVDLDPVYCYEPESGMRRDLRK
jgi:hypothetical protein